MKFSHVMMVLAALCMAGAVGAGCKRHSKAYKQAMSIKKESCGCVGAAMEYKCYKKALKRRNTVWVGLKKFRSKGERRKAKAAIRKADGCLRKLGNKHARKLFKGLKNLGKKMELNKAIKKAIMKATE